MDDAGFLAEAFARAGVTVDVGALEREPLNGGRTGAAVSRLRARAADGTSRTWVLKVVPAVRWRATLGLDRSEAELWRAGATRRLPEGLRCPTIDAARHAARDEWWLLMDDVAHGIAPPGAFDAARTRTFLRAIARMHARYWDRDDALAALPLAGFEQISGALAALNAYLARGGAVEPWLEQLSHDFGVPRALLPVLLDALAPADADFFVALCQDHGRIARALGEHPRTLCHGDLRRANISFVDDEVVLFDWELASIGPAARDLQWHWMLHAWAYPQADGRTRAERDGLLVEYVDALERELGHPVDRARFDASGDLAWLSVLCQIGCCLADPLTGASPSRDEIARARATIAEAIERARRIHERLVR